MLPASVIVLSAVTSGANLFSSLKYQSCAFSLMWNIILSYIMLFYLKIPSYVAFFVWGDPEQMFRAYLCLFGVTGNLAVPLMQTLSDTSPPSLLLSHM